jgi:uncharacterized protein
VGPEDAPILFRGESPLTAEPLGGPVRDLNIMTRRSAWRSEAARRTLTPGAAGLAEGDARIVIALDPCALLCGAQSLRLDRHDALVLEQGDHATLDQDAPARVIAVAFHRAAQGRHDA